MKTRRMFQRLLSSKSGATAIEYGLIAAIMSVVLVSGFNGMGLEIANVMIFLGDTMANAVR